MTTKTIPAKRRPVSTTGEVTDALMTHPLDPSGGGVPYLQESNAFFRLLTIERNKAARTVHDLDKDIERLQEEINARIMRREDLQTIVERCDAVLGPDRG